MKKKTNKKTFQMKGHYLTCNNCGLWFGFFEEKETKTVWVACLGCKNAVQEISVIKFNKNPYYSSLQLDET